MYVYSTLENTPVHELFLAYGKAFEGFPSTKNVSPDAFQHMLRMRGYDPEISLGAFDSSNDALAGFVLNGFRPWHGKRTAYDILTGTAPSYRKQGIANTLFENLRVLLKQKQAEQYLTEVKQDNTNAIALYQKQGFEIRRGLSSYALKKENHHTMESRYQVEYPPELGPDEWQRVISFWEFQPSWQNSLPSITAVPEIMAYAVVRSDNDILGCGVVDTTIGDIHQLAVHRDYRRRGIAGGIVSALFEKAAAIQLVLHNADDACEGMTRFLLKSGFEKIYGQYEIVLTL